jgi:hypothetical protein
MQQSLRAKRRSFWPNEAKFTNEFKMELHYMRTARVASERRWLCSCSGRSGIALPRAARRGAATFDL